MSALGVCEMATAGGLLGALVRLRVFLMSRKRARERARIKDADAETGRINREGDEELEADDREDNKIVYMRYVHCIRCIYTVYDAYTPHMMNIHSIKCIYTAFIEFDCPPVRG